MRRVLKELWVGPLSVLVLAVGAGAALAQTPLAAKADTRLCRLGNHRAITPEKGKRALVTLDRAFPMSAVLWIGKWVRDTHPTISPLTGHCFMGVRHPCVAR